MNINVTKGKAKLTFTKTEQRKVNELRQFFANIPAGLFCEEEREAAEDALAKFAETAFEDAPETPAE